MATTNAPRPARSGAARTESPNPDTPAESRRIVVVVPTYNERANLPRLVPAILGHGEQYQLVIVDDRSPDGTGSLADELAVRYPGRIEVIHRPQKLGIGPAYVAGFTAALRRGADIIVQMDADFSHDPADLPRLVAATAGHDLIIGSRYVPGGDTVGWPLPRRLLSRLGGQYARLVLGVPIADLTGGFKVWRRPLLSALDLDHVQADGYGFQIETTYRALTKNARVIELPIIYTDRVAGASKISRRIVIEAAILVWRLRFEGQRRQSAAPRREPSERNP